MKGSEGIVEPFFAFVITILSALQRCVARTEVTLRHTPPSLQCSSRACGASSEPVRRTRPVARINKTPKQGRESRAPHRIAFPQELGSVTHSAWPIAREAKTNTKKTRGYFWSFLQRHGRDTVGGHSMSPPFPKRSAFPLGGPAARQAEPVFGIIFFIGASLRHALF